MQIESADTMAWGRRRRQRRRARGGSGASGVCPPQRACELSAIKKGHLPVAPIREHIAYGAIGCSWQGVEYSLRALGLGSKGLSLRLFRTPQTNVMYLDLVF